MKIIKTLLIITIFIGLPLILNIFIINNVLMSNRAHQQEKPLTIDYSAENENITIKTSFPKFIWIEGHLDIEIISKVEGKIKCVFVDSKGGEYFSNLKTTEDLKDSEKEIHLITKPHLITVPGKYNFGLVITYINENDESEQIYTKDFEIILGMGYLILYCILIVFGTAIIVVLTKTPDEEEKKAAQKSTQPSGSIPENKIQCPECKKIIDEGLAFCPECGSRIPEFLRFNPTSSGL